MCGRYKSWNSKSFLLDFSAPRKTPKVTANWYSGRNAHNFLCSHGVFQRLKRKHWQILTFLRGFWFYRLRLGMLTVHYCTAAVSVIMWEKWLLRVWPRHYGVLLDSSESRGFSWKTYGQRKAPNGDLRLDLSYGYVVTWAKHIPQTMGLMFCGPTGTSG